MRSGFQIQTKSFTGTWMPAWVPESSATLSNCLIFCAIVQSTMGGYDGSILNGLNILPIYNDYFNLDAPTRGLNTASVFIGGFFGPLVSRPICDKLGRRPAIFWGGAFTIVGIVLQTAALNIPMFVIARIVLGFGSILSGIASGVYLSETFAGRWRAWGVVGMLNDFYYVGALIAAGITLGTGQWHSTWAWRCPSLIQAIFSLLCLLILPFIPESPYWLVAEGHLEAARIAIAQTNSNGELTDPVTSSVFKESLDALSFQKSEHGKTMTLLQIARDKTARKRLLIGMSVGPFGCIAGNIIAAYYLGDELDTAGVTDRNDKLKANVVLNVWCLFCALAGTHLAAKWGRKSMAILSEILLVICLFIIGGLSKIYADNPNGASKSLVYGDVAAMFLFQGFYSMAWTPLMYLYPPEVMNYAVGANGLVFSQLVLHCFAVAFVFVMPIALENIGWKMYIINGSWDIVIVVLIAVFWVETKGKTVEEIDARLTGKKHSKVPDVEEIGRPVNRSRGSCWGCLCWCPNLLLRRGGEAESDEGSCQGVEEEVLDRYVRDFEEKAG